MGKTPIMLFVLGLLMLIGGTFLRTQLLGKILIIVGIVVWIIAGITKGKSKKEE